VAARNTRGEQWVNIDVKESKGGKWYAAVFKPKEKEAEQPKGNNRFSDMKDDVPF
jgi:hypothetical protein